MSIKPFDLGSPADLPDEINTILIDNGVVPEPPKEVSNLKTARAIFETSGATLQAAAAQVSNLMNNADTAASRLKAVELTLKVHGILQEMEDKPVPQITVNVVGTQNKTLINLVLPTV